MASPTWNDTGRPVPSVRCRAVVIIASLASMPTTAPSGPTISASARLSSPVPQPSSSTRIPGARRSSAVATSSTWQMPGMEFTSSTKRTK